MGGWGRGAQNESKQNKMCNLKTKTNSVVLNSLVGKYDSVCLTKHCSLKKINFTRVICGLRGSQEHPVIQKLLSMRNDFKRPPRNGSSGHCSSPERSAMPLTLEQESEAGTRPRGPQPRRRSSFRPRALRPACLPRLPARAPPAAGPRGALISAHSS